MSCTQAYSSAYGSIAGVPVALLGVIWFASLSPSAVRARLHADVRAVLACKGWLVMLILFLAGSVSAVVAFPSEASLRATGARQNEQPVPLDMRAQFERWWASQPRSTVPVAGGNAAVVIVRFSDLQCPWCGVTHFALKPILAKYEKQAPGAVALVRKDYPLHPDCNPSVIRAVHAASCDAAIAVRLAGAEGRQDALEDYLYANRSAVATTAAVREAAARIGGVRDFEGRSARALDAVRADVALARLLNVRSTPTVFINGVRCEDGGSPLAPKYLDLAIELELRKAGRLR